jgi:nucleoside 2-deoxyribosyltransferase
LKLYIASRYWRRLELSGYAAELNAMGHCVTSRWIRGDHEMKDEKPSHEEARRFAEEDLHDLFRADMFVAFTESPGEAQGRARGGRHVELGFALAKGKAVIVVGHRENVFCHLPEVRQFPDFHEFKCWLESRPVEPWNQPDGARYNRFEEPII